MRNCIQKISLLFVFIGLAHAYGQDTSLVFSYADFISIVRAHHPIAYQANLKEAQAEAILQKAKGGFDPKLEGNARQKYFDGKQYYSYLNAGLKVPTWFGLTLQGGYDNNAGELLNNESLTPGNGLWSAGASLNLGNGLFIDQRRAELKQAKIYQNSTLLEQKLILNQLIYDASIAYWNWFKAYNKVQIYAEAKTTATERFEGIKRSAFIGELPFIDTLKAIIQVKDRALKLEQATLELDNKKVQLEMFLWEDGFIPLEIDSSLRAISYNDYEITRSIQPQIQEIEQYISNHPELLQYQNNIDIARIDYRLKKEQLKPTVELKYNALSNITDDQNLIQNYNLNNYTWGAKVSYPIFTRKERAGLALAEIKINEQTAKTTDKSAAIKYKITSAFNTWNSSSKQIEIFKEIVENYDALFQAEEALFNNGESSLFLVNTRDQSLLDAKIKLIDALYQNQEADMSYKYQIFGYD